MRATPSIKSTCKVLPGAGLLAQVAALIELDRSVEIEIAGDGQLVSDFSAEEDSDDHAHRSEVASLQQLEHTARLSEVVGDLFVFVMHHHVA